MTYTTQDGKTAVPVNPYKTCITGALMCGGPRCYCLEYKEFAANNPPIPLTTERPDLIGKEFQGDVVWQYFNSDREWVNSSEKECIRVKMAFQFKTRQALSVPVNGEEKAEQPKLSVEEAAEKHTQNIAEQYPYFQIPKWVFTAIQVGFISGHTHATNDANLVPLDKVVLKLQSFSDQMYSDCSIGEVTAWDLIKLYKAKYNELNDLITQIKNLTKE